MTDQAPTEWQQNPTAVNEGRAALEKVWRESVGKDPKLLTDTERSAALQAKLADFDAKTGWQAPVAPSADQVLRSQVGAGTVGSDYSVRMPHDFSGDAGVVTSEITGLLAAMNAPTSIASAFAEEMRAGAPVRAMSEADRGKFWEARRADALRAFGGSHEKLEAAQNEAKAVLKASGHRLGLDASESQVVLTSPRMLAMLKNISTTQRWLKNGGKL